METKEIIRSYWDHRSEIYSTGIVEHSEEERIAWKNMLVSTLGEENTWKYSMSVQVRVNSR